MFQIIYFPAEVTTIVHREVPETYVVHEEQHINQFETRPTIHTTVSRSWALWRSTYL